jgi:beta-phosphoglucomutase-like phosphatase (HAD superfamily)
VPPAECFVVEAAVSGIHGAKAGRMAALDLSRADEDLFGAAQPTCWSPDDVELDALAEGRLTDRDAESIYFPRKK